MKNSLGFFLCSLPVIFLVSCYLEEWHSGFLILGLLSCGAIIGVCTLALYRDLQEIPEDEGSLGADLILNARRINQLLPSERNDMATKLRGIYPGRIIPCMDADDHPDVIRVVDDNLWMVVNQNPDLLAFKDPYSPGETLVFKSDFAMRALALGFVPEVKMSDIPRKKRVKSYTKRGKC